MKRVNPSLRRESKRGRPAKFGRPSRLVALTLPEDVIQTLRTVNPDIGWAIVQLVEPLGAGNGANRASPQPQPVVELAHLPEKRALIVVREPIFRELPGVTLIPLADGRAFLAFEGQAGIADLELAILDRIEALPADSPERTAFVQFRETLRSWRRDRGFRYTTKSIIVVEQVHDRPLRRLGRLKTET